MEQRTPEWLDMRKTKIGASDAPTIMCASPWKTPYQLWREKLGFTDGPSTNYAMQRGTEMEPIALKSLETKLGMPLRPQIKLHSKRSWMMASLDAVSLDNRTVGEIKCPGKVDHDIALQGLVPEKYYAQLQHQIEVCGVGEVFYFSFHPDCESALIRVCRDEKYIKKLLIEEEKFYECMQNFDPPELVDADYVSQTGERWGQIAMRLSEIKQIKVEEEALKSELITLANGHNSKGMGITVSKCTRKGAIDYKNIPELANVNLENFRKDPTFYWRIS